MTITQALIVFPLVFLAGLVDAIAGGGGLISLPAYYMAGIPMHFAIGTNKTSAAIGTALTTYRFIKKGYIPWKLGLISTFCGLIGSFIGANIALQLDRDIFMKIMLAVVPVTAFILLTKGDFAAKREERPERTQAVMCFFIALFLGVYDGFYGPGMGTFLMILLTGWVHLDIQRANGICKAINMATNLAALFVYLTGGKVMLLLGLSAGVFGLCGNYVGSRFFERGNVRFIKAIMITVLTIFFVKLVVDVGVFGSF